MEQKNFTITGFPLIKIQSKYRIESLQHGHLYAKTLEYYRELERSTGDAAVGDLFDGMFHVNTGELRLKETGETIELNDTLIRTSASDNCVFCMLCIDPRTQRFAFSDEQREKLKSFGDTALIITDSDEFISRVKNAANRQGITAYFRPINYFDETEDYVNIVASMFSGVWNVAFWKRKAYAYQQECRFVFLTNESPCDHIELDIGDISDISVIVPVEAALKGIVEKRS